MAVSFFGLGMMEVVLLMFMGGINPGLLPSGLPPLPEDKALVSAAPEECLLYAGWYGAAEPKLGGKNRVENLLAEPEVRHFATTLWKELNEAMRRDAFHVGERDSAMVAENVLPLVEIGLTRPGVLYLSKLEFKPGDFGAIAVDAKAGLIVNAGPRAEDLRRIIAKFEEMVPERLRDEIKTVEVKDVKFKQIPTPANAPHVMYGFRGDYFIIAVGEGTAEKIVTDLKDARGPPKWLTQIHERLPVERPAAVSYFNLKGATGVVKSFAEVAGAEGAGGAVKMITRVLEVTGLDGIDSVSSVAGLGETDHVTKSLLTITGKPRGFLNLISDKPLTADNLASVPRDATWLMASRFDLANAYKQVVDMVGEFNPLVKEQLEGQLEGLQKQLGFHPVTDLLEPLGDTQVIYASPGEGGMFFGVTAVINLRNREKLTKVNDILVKMLAGEGEDPQRPSVNSFKFSGQTVYAMDVGPLPLAPTWCLTEKQLVIGLYPQSVKAYLSRKASGSLADSPDVKALLEQKPTSLMYQDTPEFVRTLYPYLQMFAPMAIHQMRQAGMKVDASLLPSGASIYPHLRPSVSVVTRRDGGIYSESHQSLPGVGGVTSMLPMAAGLWMPVVAKARTAASDVQSMNNLKQIALAMHNFHDTYRALPAPASYDGDGKPLLSWRVHILPYIEQDALYKKFKLDEPWDSKHNKELIKEMPSIYKVPGGVKVDDGKTCYLVPVGDETAFPKGEAGSNKGLSFGAISDGLSNTLMVVEAAPDKAVPWTKPDDWEFDADKPSKGLVGHRASFFLAAMCDGSVRRIPKTVKDETLKAIFTRAGGEVVEIP